MNTPPRTRTMKHDNRPRDSSSEIAVRRNLFQQFQPRRGAACHQRVKTYSACPSDALKNRYVVRRRGYRWPFSMNGKQQRHLPGREWSSPVQERVYVYGVQAPCPALLVYTPLCSRCNGMQHLPPKQWGACISLAGGGKQCSALRSSPVATVFEVALSLPRTSSRAPDSLVSMCSRYHP